MTIEGRAALPTMLLALTVSLVVVAVLAVVGLLAYLLNRLNRP